MSGAVLLDKKSTHRKSMAFDNAVDAGEAAAAATSISSPRLEDDEKCGGSCTSVVTATAAAATLNAAATSSSVLWDLYKDWARRHRAELWSADDIVSRLLFFFCPSHSNSSNSSSSSWREIIWGLLELHRLALHRATLIDDGPQQTGHHWFGTTVEVKTTPSLSLGSIASYIPAIRCALTILQTLHPIMERVVALSLSSSSGGNHRTTLMSLWNVRRLLERTRFLLRLTLLLQYWQALPAIVMPGLLRNGGGLAHNDDDPIITAEQEMARLQVVNYVGKRSGKRLFDNNGAGAGGGGGVKRSIDDSTVLKWRIKVAELLYIFRPLLYTEWQGGSSSSPQSSNVNMKPWAVSLLMDLVSLWGLQSVGCRDYNKSGRRQRPNNNVASRREWERRRMRLLLYLLRSPVWDRYTEPLAQRVGSTLQKTVPLLGNLLQCYFWDWLYHWKEYRLEEG
jgi:hypothetical protein